MVSLSRFQINIVIQLILLWLLLFLGFALFFNKTSNEKNTSSVQLILLVLGKLFPPLKTLESTFRNVSRLPFGVRKSFFQGRTMRVTVMGDRPHNLCVSSLARNAFALLLE